jgi:uncharacterized lipoprotein YajG
MLATSHLFKEVVMQRILSCILGIGLMLVALVAAAEAPEKEVVALEVPAGLVREICAQPVWNGVTAVWKGVTDERPGKAIGLQTKSKGKEPIEVFAIPTLDSVFDKALRDVFTACGMKFIDKGASETLKLSVQIKQFYAGVEKKLITGKAKAVSALTFTADKAMQTKTIDIGNDMESKEARKGDIKGLTKALNSLLAETLKQVPTTQQLRDMK